MTLRDAVFEAHVQHELAALHGEIVPTRIAAAVRALFAWMHEVRLEDVSSSAQITEIIQRYAVELRVGGGIMELTGEMAQLVMASSTGDETRLDQLLSDSAYEQFADKIANLSGAWRALIERVWRSEAGELLQAELLTWAMNDLLHTRAAPLRLQRLVLGLEMRLAHALAKRLGRAASGERHADVLAVLAPELLRSIADEIWTSVSSLRLRELFALIDGQDVEDFVVLGHEFWLTYRKSPYFQRLMQEMVEHFFAKYGGQTLLELVDDMGVSEPLVAEGLSQLLAPIVARAAETGFAEQQIRARLRAFYDSAACAALFAQR